MTPEHGFTSVCVCVCVYLYAVPRLQGEGAVLPEDGQWTGQHGAQHPGQRYHPEANVLTHPGLQVVHNTPETHRDTHIPSPSPVTVMQRKEQKKKKTTQEEPALPGTFHPPQIPFGHPTSLSLDHLYQASA